MRKRWLEDSKRSRMAWLEGPESEEGMEVGVKEIEKDMFRDM